MVWTWFLISVNGCDGWWLEKMAFGEVNAEGQNLRLLVLNEPLTYQKKQGLEVGYEYELLQSFARDLGYHLVVKTARSRDEIIRRMKNGEADLAAGRFSDSVKNTSLLRSPVYDEEKLALVCRRDVNVQFNFWGSLDKSNSWTLGLNSNMADSLALRGLLRANTHLKVRNISGKTSRLMSSLEQGRADCTVMDRLEARYHVRFYRKLRILKDMAPSKHYFFLIGSARADLQRQMRLWIIHAARQQALTQTKKMTRQRIDQLGTLDIRKFLRDREFVLPRFSPTFRKHALEFGIPWQLAAAVAYQESHWNPDAESFTGVKGLMQLTNETAEHLGVSDRLDADQSIWGGVKYLKMLLDRQPKSLPLRERLALTLATYNVGPAHMWDAQNLAVRLGKNPYSWRDLQTVLPLLADKEYLDLLKYGPARGEEPVQFVHQVFAYLELI